MISEEKLSFVYTLYERIESKGSYSILHKRTLGFSNQKERGITELKGSEELSISFNTELERLNYCAENNKNEYWKILIKRKDMPQYIDDSNSLYGSSIPQYFTDIISRFGKWFYEYNIEPPVSVLKDTSTDNNHESRKPDYGELKEQVIELAKKYNLEKHQTVKGTIKKKILEELKKSNIITTYACISSILHKLGYCKSHK